MDVLLQRQVCWTAENHICDMHIELVSVERLSTFVPVQLIVASSSFLNSILSSFYSCEFSTIPSILLPSVRDSTLHLLSQILKKGETKLPEGFKTTMANMEELQSVFDLLGLNIKIWEAVLPYPVVKEVSAEFVEDFEEPSEKLQGKGVIKEENKLTESNSPSCSEEFNDFLKRRAAALKDDLMNTCDEGGNISIFSEQPAKMTKAKQDINSANLSDWFWNPHKLSILSTYFPGMKNSNCEKCGNRRKSRGAQCERCEIAFLCHECQMPFASKGLLRIHKRRNHEETIEIYKRNECEKTFMSHKRSKHEGLVYSCQFCEYKVGQKVGLKIHILNKHPKMKIVLENP